MHQPHATAPIGNLGFTALVMFSLARTKRRVATATGSEPLASEASMTLLDGWLAAGILIALAQLDRRPVVG